MDLYTVRKQLNMGIPLTSIKLRVTDYARVSTDTEEQQKSLQNQVEHFEEYIKQNPNWTYIEGYIDEGITGTSDIKRDDFMRMIEDAKYGKFDLIITKEISRFSRNTLDSIKYTRQLLSYGVAVLFVNDNINTALPDSELRLTIMASMAQDEIRRLSERVKFGMNRAIQRGEILGNDLMYGYKKNKETGELCIIEEEAKVVRKIYELYVIKEYSLSGIAKTLNKDNIKTRLGNKWCVSTISRMIENPKYKGYYCGKKTEIVDYMTKKVKYLQESDWVIHKDEKKIPPIIDSLLWNKANIRLENRKKAFSKRKKDKTIYKNRYLYSAKIYCNKHNTVFHRRQFRKHKRDITWICSEYLKYGKEICDSPNIRESEINFIIKDLTEILKLDLSKAKTLLMNFYNKEEDFSVEQKINDKKIVEKDLLSRKEKLLELSLEGRITNTEFSQKREFIDNQLTLLQSDINKLAKEKESLKGMKKTRLLEEILKEKLNSERVLNYIIKSILDKIVVSKKNDINNSVELDIYLYNKENINKKSKKILNKNYQFKRGYDTKATKRYIVDYKVNFLMSI